MSAPSERRRWKRSNAPRLAAHQGESASAFDAPWLATGFFTEDPTVCRTLCRSAIVSRDLFLAAAQQLYDEDLDRSEEMPGLGFADYYVLPHLGSEHFPALREDRVREVLARRSEKCYVIDDRSALVDEGGKRKIVSQGAYFEVN